MKNILLTGCSRGVGLSIAKSLIASGYNVYGVSRKITPEYEQLMNENENQVFYKSFDLADPDL